MQWVSSHSLNNHFVFMSFSCFSAVWPQTHTAGLQRHCETLATLRPLACRRHQQKVDVDEFDIPNIPKKLLHKLLCKAFHHECWHVVSASLPQCPLHMGYGPCWSVITHVITLIRLFLLVSFVVKASQRFFQYLQQFDYLICFF